MKSPFVRDLTESPSVSISLLVQAKDVRQKKTGEPYLSLVLSDQSGEIEAKMWDNAAEVLDTFDRDDFVRVKGLVQNYHNRLQLVIHKLRRLEDHEIDFADFFPASKHDSGAMWEELRAHVNAVGNPHLRALLNAMLDDPEIARRYRIAPAAKQIHHAFLSGLLEHVISLCRLAKAVSPNYPFVDSDLVITGCVLHDIGKIYELSYDRGFAYTAEGQLLGHLMIGLKMVGEKLQSLPDFPPRLRNLVEHMIISHHGKLEYGSPKVPMFAEAILFHYLDDLDSKMECSRALIDRDMQQGGHFTAFSHSLERVILKKDAYLNPAPEAAAPPAVSPQHLPPSPPAPVVHAAPVMPPVPQAPRPLPPVPAHPGGTHQTTVKSGSVFGSKLLDALRPEK